MSTPSQLFNGPPVITTVCGFIAHFMIACQSLNPGILKLGSADKLQGSVSSLSDFVFQSVCIGGFFRGLTVEIQKFRYLDSQIGRRPEDLFFIALHLTNS